MPLPLQKITKFTSFAALMEGILYVLENATEESFWRGLVGERLLKIFQRYFGNDFIMISVLFYIAPILRTKSEDLAYRLYYLVRGRSQTLTVRVFRHDFIFNAVNNYIRKNTERIEGMNYAQALYTKDANNHLQSNYYTSDDDDEEPLPEVGLYPLVNTANSIEHNGYTITVQQHAEESGELKRNTVDYLELTMEVKNGETMDTFRDILQDWADDFNKKEKKSEISLMTWNTYNWDDEITFKTRSIDTVDLPTGMKEMLLQDIECFMSNKAWYEMRGISYHRGYLLHGPPGTGKSSLIQALAGHLRMNLASIKLNEVNSDSDFQTSLAKLPKKTLVIIEDIDHYKSFDNLSHSGMLNALDGLNSSDGTIVILTANDVNKIEPALLRPGRMDMKLKLDYAVHSQMKQMYRRFFRAEGNASAAPESSSNASPRLEEITKKHLQGKASSGNGSPLSHPILLPPTPPVTDEDDTVQERTAFLESALDKLLAQIPEHTITTAELQSLFTAVSLEKGPNASLKDDIIPSLLDRLPTFLDQVQEDRKQAKKHAASKKKGSSSKDSDNEDDDDDDDEGNTSDDSSKKDKKKKKSKKSKDNEEKDTEEEDNDEKDNDEKDNDEKDNDEKDNDEKDNDEKESEEKDTDAQNSNTDDSEQPDASANEETASSTLQNEDASEKVDNTSEKEDIEDATAPAK
ncbi:hypothetical protein BC940DRAFT_316699 [Gongronella butleri]|nr:hypothetical protein BC940DRAFT_316699 [Gongronella butleri]